MNRINKTNSRQDCEIHRLLGSLISSYHNQLRPQSTLSDKAHQNYIRSPLPLSRQARPYQHIRNNTNLGAFQRILIQSPNNGSRICEGYAWFKQIQSPLLVSAIYSNTTPPVYTQVSSGHFLFTQAATSDSMLIIAVTLNFYHENRQDHQPTDVA
jgi:hypothetical protein